MPIATRGWLSRLFSLPDILLGQVPQWNGTQFVGVTPVTDGIFNPLLYSYGTIFMDLASGDNIIPITVPSGYKAIIPLTMGVRNESGNSANITQKIVRNAVTYTSRLAAAVANNGVATIELVLYANDQFIVNTDVATGVQVIFGTYYLVPDSGNLKVFSLPLSNGNNTVYTVPAGKKARVVSILAIDFSGNYRIIIYNGSGNTRVVSGHRVAAAGSPSTSNRFRTQSISNNLVAALNFFPFGMIEGDSLVLVSDGDVFANSIFIWEEDA